MKLKTRYDLAAAYRICPSMSAGASALGIFQDKFHLSEICARSFQRSLAGLKVKLYVLLDACPPHYADLFRDLFRPEDLVLLSLDREGNHATFGRQLDILLSQEDSNIVYFAEDDYLYLPGQFPTMVELLNTRERVSFVSPYDHPDYYRMGIHPKQAQIRLFHGRHWRTAASTCLTFLTRRSTLERTSRVLRTYCRRNHDCSMWLSLTKPRCIWPGGFLRLSLCEGRLQRMAMRTWGRCGWQAAFGSREELWVPIPAVATHVVRDGLSPGIDWTPLFARGPIHGGPELRNPPTHAGGVASPARPQPALGTLGASR